MKTDAQRHQTFTRRAVVVGGLQALAGAVIGGRLVYLSVFEGEKYRTLAEENRVAVRLIPPRRGWLTDRNGQPMAINQPEYRLEIVPEQIRDMAATLKQLETFLDLPPEEMARIRKEVEEKPPYLPVEVASNVDWEAYSAVNVRLPELSGVQPVRGFTRYYPDGAAVGHLMGYVGAPTREQYLEADDDPLFLHPAFKVGKDGVERELDERLRGERGARRVEVNARGRIIRDLETQPDTPGETVRLSIDRELQAFSARRIGPESGSVVVLDVTTGEVLTMVSMPAFDPNTFSDGISHKEWDSLMGDEMRPLINKSVQGLYPPGSTFKPVTALAALAHGIDPDEHVVCRGGYQLDRHRFACWRRGGHGATDLYKAIYQSCNVYFYTRGRQIGIDAIHDMGQKLGLGETFDTLQVPNQNGGVLPDPEWKRERYDQDWLVGETLNSSIGQGYNALSPLQLAVMVSRLASGRAVMPTLLAGDGREGALLDIDPRHLEDVRHGMDLCVNGPAGTAGRSRLPLEEVRMGGKTGTAQVRALSKNRGVVPWKYRDHGLFIAFAPVENPRYAISVTIEHGGGGSVAAAPIAKDVMTFLYDRDKALESLRRLETMWGIEPVAADLFKPPQPMGRRSEDGGSVSTRPA
ncbi:penicillin-binding protein 2 [Pacificimonas flava]|uniref:Penicillin-binding protein 2 n=2 Tax=Pacificimonas TaxID=1960290 RepID=A0A219B5Q0_9SPHN|nr:MULTISPECIES: penicillin-binding protein 2 [Pacificimonas]MBZ6379164.1 penicillin-binding protein 2 [Pacificimonas aurantium]OWV33611.1 penicillin-binding protein 2 [Pacificimonas flava]